MHCVCIDSRGGRENGSVFPAEIQPVVSVLHCDRQIVRVCLLCLLGVIADGDCGCPGGVVIYGSSLQQRKIPHVFAEIHQIIMKIFFCVFRGYRDISAVIGKRGEGAIILLL